MAAPTYTWKRIFPVMLGVALDGAEHTTADYIAAVQEVTERDFPDQAHRMLQHSSVPEDRARWAIWQARHFGFLEDVARGVTRITDAGRVWAADHPYPLGTVGYRDLSVRQAELRRAREETQAGQPALEPDPEEVGSTEADYFWVIRAGSNGEREQRALAEGLGLPGLYIGPVTSIPGTRREIEQAIRAHDPNISRKLLASTAGQAYRLLHEMQVGDTAVMPSKLHPGRLYVGTVSGPATIDSQDPDPDSRSRIPITWNAEPLERSDLALDLRNSIRGLLTLFTVSRHNALERLQSVVDGQGDPDLSPETTAPAEPNLDWIPFFTEFTQALLPYREDRPALQETLREAAQLSGRPSMFNPLWKWVRDGVKENATDVEPFTILSTIHRGITPANRIAMCAGIKEAFALSAELPTSFDGIPVSNNMRVRFESAPDDAGDPNFYDTRWDLFAAGIALADGGGLNAPEQLQQEFVTAFDAATAGRSLPSYTMGLFWTRPEMFLPLDRRTIAFVSSEDGAGLPSARTITDGREYLGLLGDITTWLPDAEVHPATMAGISVAAFSYTTSASAAPADAPSSPSAVVEKTAESSTPAYTIQSILSEGAFMPRSQLESALSRWRTKKNIILQGPPGTGKTWLARKLAHALIGSENEELITVVQFHPSTSYEDFVQGYRPTAEAGGRLTLMNGPFLRAVETARDNAPDPHVVIIEEINRGNPAQIFGEMLTLLEADKRNAESQLTTLYAQEDDQPLFLPENLYVIGTMNQADRSLAMVDMALRRRFAFISLTPALNDAWLEFCTTERGLDRATLEDVRERIAAVNDLIRADSLLGEAYLIGHSFVTPLASSSSPASSSATRAWFEAIVDTDLQPLLEEYWYDRPEQVETALAILRA
ncbi:AAA family ATPase [Brachybacterium sp. UMB0905]|uniref:AAA family ATPase n=1 Tax=Brachybacterium sp. UMB0905 TaxID=2069310 RepID=UPI000C80D5D2|nr:AAA family ATPase [Brachybacterium sp. UMB0905]PMC74921.1 AAA family ATPase [Brachybacterium sp. UMB0905]